MPSPVTPVETTSSVHSLAGVRLVLGLLGPFLTPAGQQEVERVWGAPVEVLFEESVALATQVKNHPALHAALGVWTREHDFPAQAVARLADYLQALPADPEAAQAVLDGWASAHTHGMIPTFPCTVTEATRAVLASALAVDDTWARHAEETLTLFHGERVKGFDISTGDADARTTMDGRAVRVSVGLTSGLVMNFCISEDGVGRATALLGEPEVFTKPVCNGQPFISTRPVRWQTTDVAVLLPEYEIRSNLDLADDAAAWGLVEAMRPFGVPGLGGLEISEARQDAFIEVTHTGVRAAAVTALSLRASGMISLPEFSQRVVRFSEPFAFRLELPGMPVPLFAGIYCCTPSIS